MSEEADAAPRPPTDATADSGLRCPQCGYNLTGLTENRCPECGTTFDPDALRRALAGRPEPIPGWDDPNAPNAPFFLVAFFRTCWAIWFHPREFARRFPWAYDVGSVMRFWFMARVIAVLLFWGGGIVVCLLTSSPGGYVRDDSIWLRVCVLVTWDVMVGSLVCESLLVLLFRWLAKPRIAVQPQRNLDASASWWGATAMHSSFLVATSCTCGLTVSLMLLTGIGEDAVFVLLLLPAAIVALLWWWSSLAICLRERARRTWGRNVAMAIIPEVGVISIGIGIAASWCCVGFLR